MVVGTVARKTSLIGALPLPAWSTASAPIVWYTFRSILRKAAKYFAGETRW
jgi:hypothetical protein